MWGHKSTWISLWPEEEDEEEKSRWRVFLKVASLRFSEDRRKIRLGFCFCVLESMGLTSGHLSLCGWQRSPVTWRMP